MFWISFEGCRWGAQDRRKLNSFSRTAVDITTSLVASNNRNVFSLRPQIENSKSTARPLFWSFSASGLSAFFGLWLFTQISDSIFTGTSFLCVYFLRILVIGCRMHLNSPGCSHLKILNHICKCPFSESGHIHKFQDLGLSFYRSLFNLLPETRMVPKFSGLSNWKNEVFMNQDRKRLWEEYVVEDGDKVLSWS